MFRTPTLRLIVAALVGGALAFYVLKSNGIRPIFLAATAVEWRGFAILCLYQLGLFVLLGAAWRALIPVSCHARTRVFIWARMVRDATTDLLPFSHLGGIVLSARTAVARGVAQPIAYASIVTDVTAEMLAQIAFTAAGIAILAMLTPHNSLTLSVAGSAVLGFAAIVLGCAAVIALQRYGRAAASKLIARFFPNAAAIAEAAAMYIEDIYRRPAGVGLSVLLHCGGWLASALSTWIALYLMGVQARVAPILALESLVCALRSMAFLVPNGLGVQEVAYATIAPLFGIGAETGLAISVLKRARDTAVGLPILLLWHWSENRRFFAFNSERTEPLLGP
jgi:putative membrane protein